jgi:hypothetical protein
MTTVRGGRLDIRLKCIPADSSETMPSFEFTFSGVVTLGPVFYVDREDRAYLSVSSRLDDGPVTDGSGRYLRDSVIWRYENLSEGNTLLVQLGTVPDPLAFQLTFDDPVVREYMRACLLTSDYFKSQELEDEKFAAHVSKNNPNKSAAERLAAADAKANRGQAQHLGDADSRALAEQLVSKAVLAGGDRPGPDKVKALSNLIKGLGQNVVPNTASLVLDGPFSTNVAIYIKAARDLPSFEAELPPQGYNGANNDYDWRSWYRLTWKNIKQRAATNVLASGTVCVLRLDLMPAVLPEDDGDIYGILPCWGDSDGLNKPKLRAVKLGRGFEYFTQAREWHSSHIGVELAPER